jgi:SAM-dependent methyltransferase
MRLELVHPDAVKLSAALYPPTPKFRCRDPRLRISSNGKTIAEAWFSPPEANCFAFTEIPPGYVYAQTMFRVEEIDFPEKQLDIEIVDAASGKSILEQQSYHWRGYGPFPIPPADKIFRVAGAISPEMFCFTGATWYIKLKRLTRRYMRRNLHDFERVLDWGCGCGRILRFFPPDMMKHLIGIDIDEENIDWCRKNIPTAQFLTVDPMPPTPISSEQFDIIFGHSVFTHLSEEDQDLWLAELRRLLKPGGYCFVTVNAELAWFACCSHTKGPWQLYELLNKGIRDSGHLNVGVDRKRPGYYRNTFHTSKYVTEHWGKFFEVVDIVPGFADFQDLVILRKRCETL